MRTIVILFITAILLSSIAAYDVAASPGAVPTFFAPTLDEESVENDKKDGETTDKKTPPPPASDKDARIALDRFEDAYSNNDFDLPILKAHNQMEAIDELAKFDHKNVTTRLVKIVKDKKVDRKVWLKAVDALAQMQHNGKPALSTLRRYFDPNKAEPQHTVHVLRTLGALRDKKMTDDCLKLFLHKDDFVAIEAVRALGNIGDRSVLPKLRELLELNMRDPSKGVNVRVDTGTAGNADRNRARSAGKRMEAMIRGERELMLKTIRESLEKLCGTKIETPDELRDWMLRNKNKW